MLSIHHLDERGLQRASVDPAIFFVASKLDPSLLWVDLLEPTAEEEALIEEQFHVAVPTREEMREIETSNRLYEEDGVLFLTATVVTQLDLSVAEGEFVVLLGESGCGKSTTLRMIAGLEEVTEGQILIDGQDMARVPPNRRPVNMVFQSYAVFPHMTVYQNIA